MSRDAKPQPSAPLPDHAFSAMPDFARAIRGLANVPKAEADAAEGKKKPAKKTGRKK